MPNVFGWLGMREERRVLVSVREHVEKVREVVRLLRDALTACGEGRQEQVEAIHTRLSAAEHEADKIRRALLTSLSQGLMLPPDRDDLVRLIERLDHVADAAQGASRMLVLFDASCPAEVLDELIAFAEVLIQATDRLGEALVSLYRSTPEATLQKCTEVEELEEECDRRRAELFRRIFSMDLSAARLLLLHDLIESMEETADLAEDTADVIRNLAVKIKR